MKFKQFLDNPMGKGESAIQRSLYKELLDSKYDTLVKNKGNRFKTNIYKELTGDNYYIHIIIPTETERDNTYDVVLYLYDTGEEKSKSLVNTHDVKVFCNNPAFAYTFAHTCIEEGLIIESLMNKYPDQIIQNRAEIRNRRDIVNYDKYLYFGCKYAMESRLLDRQTLSFVAKTYTPMMNNSVRDLDKILMEYKKAKVKLDRKKVDDIHEKIDNRSVTKRVTKAIDNHRIKPMSKTSGKKNNRIKKK